MKYLKRIGLLLLIITYGCIARKASENNSSQPKQTNQGKFRLLTYNVLTGFQKSPSQVNRFVEWVKDKKFDVIAFQEMSTFTQDSLESFAKRYGHHYAVLLKGNNSPIGMTSKYPISNVKKMIDSMHHGCIYAQVRDFNVFITHLSPFSYQNVFKR